MSDKTSIAKSYLLATRAVSSSALLVAEMALQNNEVRKDHAIISKLGKLVTAINELCGKDFKP